MQNLFEVLNREIGFLKEQNAALDSMLATAIKERDEARTQIRNTASRAEAAEQECTRLRDKLAAIPPTLSRAQYDEPVDKHEEV